jgi:hypothetical protein
MPGVTRRLGVEWLENRLLPANIVANESGDYSSPEDELPSAAPLLSSETLDISTYARAGDHQHRGREQYPTKQPSAAFPPVARSHAQTQGAVPDDEPAAPGTRSLTATGVPGNAAPAVILPVAVTSWAVSAGNSEQAEPGAGPAPGDSTGAGTGPNPAPTSVESPPPVPEPDESEPFAFLDGLAIRVNPAAVERAVGQLAAALDAVIPDPFDAESFWVRVGYWAVAVSAAAVGFELVRQELRVRRAARSCPTGLGER